MAQNSATFVKAQAILPVIVPTEESNHQVEMTVEELYASTVVNQVTLQEIAPVPILADLIHPDVHPFVIVVVHLFPAEVCLVHPLLIQDVLAHHTTHALPVTVHLLDTVIDLVDVVALAAPITDTILAVPILVTRHPVLHVRLFVLLLVLARAPRHTLLLVQPLIHLLALLFLDVLAQFRVHARVHAHAPRVINKPL